MLAPVSRQRGLTIVELMIGLTITAVILAIGVPSFGVWVQNTRVRNAADALINGMNLARGEAVRRNSAVMFELSRDSSWEVSVNGTTIQKRPAADGSSGITVTPSGGATQVTFNGVGAVIANADGSISLTQVDVESDLASRSDGARPLRVMLSLAGSMRMCDPSVASDDPRTC